ncbi:hypothetical protein [Brevundimonas sp.]|uniref:hypothetical protein n=1 Tax=Brevundimonas sp. TaxID=1871086 RepID=UPI00289D957D|nr:hypothetical protein [Brevundimonas sp.]
MGGAYDEKLAALAGLFKALMAAPLKPLNRGHLPQTQALYVLYQDDEPISVGSPPYLDEKQLQPFVRIGVSIAIGNMPGSKRATRDESRTAKVLHARWIEVEDPLMRLMLETYAGQSLGVSVSNPKLIEAMMKPPQMAPASRDQMV